MSAERQQPRQRQKKCRKQPAQQTAAQRYDKALHKGLKLHPVPVGQPVPTPTSQWPAENVAFLERYQAWLKAGAAATSVIAQHRIPVAGYVLGLAQKPHYQLDLDADLEKARAYAHAKGASDSWLRNCGHSLDWLRRFLRHERGFHEPPGPVKYGNPDRYKKGLPVWLVTELQKFLVQRQANWRPSRKAQATYQFWHTTTRSWRWLLVQAESDPVLAGLPGGDLTGIRRTHLYGFQDHLLAQKYAVSSVNLALHTFQGSLRFLGRRGYDVPPRLVNMRGLKRPDSLPRFLTDDELRRLRADLVGRVEVAVTDTEIRDRRFDLAAFFLLWHGGMRSCEVVDLRLEDVHLTDRRIIIRCSKGLKDRTIFLTEPAAAALDAFLEMRGSGLSDHFFLYRYRQISKDLSRCRIKAAGKRAGVKVTPHMLRHSFATQLLNAGCQITSISALMGHKRLETTMVYARVHDHTVASDYYKAMAVIEQRLALAEVPVPEEKGPEVTETELLTCVEALQASGLDETQRQLLAVLARGLKGRIVASGGVDLEGGPLPAGVNVGLPRPQPAAAVA